LSFDHTTDFSSIEEFGKALAIFKIKN